MTIYDLKPKFQALLRPFVKTLAAKGYTANQVTWLALVLSIATGCLIALFSDEHAILILVPFVMFVRMALNAMDGMLAKEHAMQSDKGAILNEMGDMVSDAALYLPFALIDGVCGVIVVLFVCAALFTEAAGILTWAVVGDRRYDGPMGKSDRAFVIGALSLVLFLGVDVGIWVEVVFSILLLLSLVTVYNRIHKALR
jgi:CDP-diacylglycerol--glycerol-3-phosphate 3-phosphatidyltransferase